VESVTDVLGKMIRNLIFLGISLSLTWHLFQAFLLSKMPHQ
jgi:hypothetical protein